MFMLSLPVLFLLLLLLLCDVVVVGIDYVVVGCVCVGVVVVDGSVVVGVVVVVAPAGIGRTQISALATGVSGYPTEPQQACSSSISSGFVPLAVRGNCKTSHRL